MQILIDARLLAKGSFSGIHEYTRRIIDELLRLDQKNHYRLFYNSFRKKEIPPLWKDHPRCEVIDWRIPNQIIDFSSRFFRTPAMDTRTKTDLVFSPHFNILETKKAPRIITFHDLSFLHHPYFFGIKERFWHWRQDYARHAKMADGIIAVSEFTKSDLVEILGVPQERIRVIYSGVSEEFKVLSPDDRELLAFKARYDLHAPYLLYLGTLEPRKNVPAIIRAFNILKRDPMFKDYRLIIAGRPVWLYREILTTASRSPYRDTIIFWGPVAPGEKIFLYNLARVFVYPSFFEGFGFPPLEAQACGCPAVVGDRTSLPEIVGDSALKVNPWKIEELSEALRYLLLKENEREGVIKAGLHNAKRFNWQTTAQKTLSLLTDEKYVSRHQATS